MKYIKPSNKSWCVYCKKHHVKKDLTNTLDKPFDCEDCYICECGHPTAWHSENGCHAMEDSCGCSEFKAKKKKQGCVLRSKNDNR